MRVWAVWLPGGTWICAGAVIIIIMIMGQMPAVVVYASFGDMERLLLGGLL